MIYTSQQIIHAFAISVNAASEHKFSSFQEMQTWVTEIEKQMLNDSTIQSYIGSDWIPVWGPVVYSKNPTGPNVIADNTMGCYYSLSQKMFVIPIAGTNPISMFDWMSEDFDVSTLVSWSNVSLGAGANLGSISAATKTGVDILLAMKDNSGNSLIQALSYFIKNNNVTNATVAVCGHSLGGALCPCIALYLHENRAQWDPASSQQIAAYPTAGPTPGDSGFATYYNSVINAKYITYVSLYNSLDVVPLAWAAGDLETIPNIYPNIYGSEPTPPATQKNDFMGIMACGLALNALAAPPPITIGDLTFNTNNTYTQVAGRKQLQGTINSLLDDGAWLLGSDLSLHLPPSLANHFGTSLTNLIRFAAQAVYQHTDAYYRDIPPSFFHPTKYTSLLNIGDFYKALKDIPPPNAVEVDMTSALVKKFTGIDLEKVANGKLKSAATHVPPTVVL